MRKNHIVTLAACGMLATASAVAQQLPNVGFEGEWVECYPWNSVYAEFSLADALATMGQTGFTLQPQGWTVSNVLGVVSERDPEYGGGYGALGSTIVGGQPAGCDSKTALSLTNAPNPFMSAQIVPAFATLGTSFATNTLDVTTFQPANKDGGCFGGLKMTARPDALTLDYQRGFNDPEAERQLPATVLVYAWKGSWSQAEVPGNNAMGPTAVTVTMTDRDRNILDIPTDQGGAVTRSDDAELIAKTIHMIEGAAPEWTSLVVPVDYLSDAAPEKINVVLAANDYFDSNNIVSGDWLNVDNVKFAYYSRLGSAAFGGNEVEAFSPDTYSYTMTGTMPASAEDCSFTLLGGGKSASVSTALESNTATVTVSNTNGEDLDGKNEHVYTFTWPEQAQEAEAVKYSGKLTIEMMGGMLTPEGGQDAIVTITPAGANTCRFVLPDFTLDLGGGDTNLGDIVVDNVTTTQKADGITEYNGTVSGFSLMEGAIIADIVLQGTTDDKGNAAMNIDVTWNEIPIKVVFNGSLDESAGVAGIAPADATTPVEFYNLKGVRVASPARGIYIRRQGNTTSKVIVK